MDRKVWEQDGFTLEALAMWRCPSCDYATLKLKICEKGQPVFYDRETTGSKTFRTKEHLGDDHKQSLFIGMLECPSCREIVSFYGTGACIPIPVYDEDGVCTNLDYEDRFYPQGFTQAPHIFSIPPKCPKEVRALILDSFKLFWVDHASCANKIRAAVEALLTSLHIRTISAARKFKPLWMRIEEYAKINPEAGEMLSAIKWIGNAGSHDRTIKIDRAAILTAFEMLESVLVKLYDEKAGILTRTAKEIVRKKDIL